MSLNRHERFVALLFGVFIDFDHLLAVPRYLADSGMSSMMTFGFEDPSGLPWKSLLHRPIGAFVVLPIAIGWRFLVPAAFWGIHILLDTFQQNSASYSLALEAVIFSVLVVVIVFLDYKGVTRTKGEQTIREYCEDVCRRLSWLAGRVTRTPSDSILSR
ncbi:TPA: hypothetical protein HA259_02940 [Thermoplasmata archaeon]|nr:hypothetical protein [Thermoplasmata archaeon]